VLNVRIPALDAQANQVVKISIGDAFNIQVDEILLEVQLRFSNNVNLVLSECKRSQGMRILIRFGD
jgi:hypothetical protein